MYNFLLPIKGRNQESAISIRKRGKQVVTCIGEWLTCYGNWLIKYMALGCSLDFWNPDHDAPSGTGREWHQGFHHQAQTHTGLLILVPPIVGRSWFQRLLPCWFSLWSFIWTVINRAIKLLNSRLLWVIWILIMIPGHWDMYGHRLVHLSTLSRKHLFEVDGNSSRSLQQVSVPRRRDWSDLL